MPTVSVIVPVFNDEAFLRVALHSIAQQTFRNFEVIVCDDGSTDRSCEIARELSRDDRRFHLVANRDNVGMTRNWNRALEWASGRYVVKLDSDDALRAEALDVLVRAMEGPDRPVVAYCRTLDCDADLQPTGSYLGERAFVRARVDPLQCQCRNGHAWYELSFDDLQLWCSNAQIHRRDVLVEMGGWDESWGCASDTDLILRVLERDEAVSHIPYPGVLYRHRPGSVSAQYRDKAWLRWESCLIHLASMSRYHSRGGHMSSPLRRAWWRYWVNWQHLQARGEEDLVSLRSDARDRLLKQASQVKPLPTTIWIEGALRQGAWNLRHGRRSVFVPRGNSSAA
jgi:glycosyltransferase involved in cell wall biosynthesis